MGWVLLLNGIKQLIRMFSFVLKLYFAIALGEAVNDLRADRDFFSGKRFSQVARFQT